MKKYHCLFLILPAFFAIGCAGIGFEKAWDQAVAEQASSGKGNPAPVAGPWTGTWKTDTNGHTGNLRCLVTPAEGSTYDFRYHATWFKIFRGGYRLNFEVKPTSAGYQVKGRKNLGLFGDFGHDGLIKGDAFHATYSNKRGDLGSFDMKRPELP